MAFLNQIVGLVNFSYSFLQLSSEFFRIKPKILNFLRVALGTFLSWLSNESSTNDPKCCVENILTFLAFYFEYHETHCITLYYKSGCLSLVIICCSTLESRHHHICSANAY